MLYLVKSPTSSSPPIRINGRGLSHRRLSARARACICAQILQGEVSLELSTSQVSLLLGVSQPYVRHAETLSPGLRARIAQGYDDQMTPFTPVPKALEPAPLALSLPTPVSDTELACVIRTAGVDRTLSIACEIERSMAVA